MLSLYHVALGGMVFQLSALKDNALSHVAHRLFGTLQAKKILPYVFRQMLMIETTYWTLWYKINRVVQARIQQQSIHKLKSNASLAL